MPSPPIGFETGSQGSFPYGSQLAISPSLSPNRAELLATLQANLEEARSEYGVRRFDKVHLLLESIKGRLPHADAPRLSVAEQSGFALLEASLHTLQGRLSKQFQESLAAFELACSLFAKYAPPVPETPGLLSRLASYFAKNPEQTQTLNVRAYTDYGISLFRTSRYDEARRVLSAVCESGVAPAEALAYLGYVEMSRKEYISSESWLRSALRLSPSDATILYWLGRVLRFQGKKDEAASLFCEAGAAAYNLKDYSSGGRYNLWALRENPESEPALRLAPIAYYWNSRPRLALLVIEKYIKSQPSNMTALGWRGLLLREGDRVEESIEVLRGIEVESADDAWILGELVQSLLLSGLGTSVEAVTAAEKAVELSPEDPFLLRIRARVFKLRGELEHAIRDLRRVDSITPGLEEVALELSEALINSNEVEPALEQLLKAAKGFPRSGRVQYGLGFCYERQGMYPQALSHYRRSTRLDPEFSAPLIQLLNLLIQQGLTEDALEEMEIRVAGPLGYIALWKRGSLLTQSNQWQAALDSLSAGVSAARQADVLGDNPEMLLDLGNVLRQLGRYEECKKIYDEALEMGRDRVDVLSALAWWFCDLAEFAKANDIVEEALKISAEDPSLWLTKGWCLQHLGASQDARGAYQTAVDLSGGKDPWCLKGLANVLMEFDRDHAHRIFTELLEEQKYQRSAEEIAGRPSPNATLLGLLGWCNYRLGRYEEATRLYQASLSQSPDHVSEFFDLALTLLAAGRVEPARKAYRDGIEFSQRSEPDRLRGQYYIALFDLANAVKLNVVSFAAAEPIISDLIKRLSAVGVEVSQLTWLPKFAAPS